MKLTNKAIEAITLRTRNKLALAMDCSVVTVDRWIKDNEENGDLTKAMALQVIAEETGIAETDLLEVEDKSNALVSIMQ